MDRTQADNRPWYRHLWPWLLISGPLGVILASVVTLWFALRSSDGLVSEDYYRQGLGAIETLHRSDRARSLGLTARVRFTSDRVAVRLMAGSADFVPPPALRITISHPTRAGLDQTRLAEARDGEYSVGYRLPASGHWILLVEDSASQWRLLGKVQLPMQGEAEIGMDDGSPVIVRQ